jgi:hypothetical protein
MTELLSIANRFNLTTEVAEIHAFGSGHIHDTYKITTTASGAYVLQKLNIQVFRDPEAVMQNLRAVTSHIRKKLENEGIRDISRKVLVPVWLRNGDLMYVDELNQVWRCFEYITDHTTFDKAVNNDQVFEGGKAYGRFLQFLSDLSVEGIKDTIPDFHNLDFRLKQFSDARHYGNPERILECRVLIGEMESRAEEMCTLRRLGQEGRIPVRIVHHDTKINNVLYGLDEKALCVIDLDTVMPGYVHDDFGDAIRTFTNTGDEDDADLSKVGMNINYFESFARGFLTETRDMLTATEKEYLALSARVMTYMQVLRFFTDYLNGDIYYKIHHPTHNLQRTYAQFALLRSMEEQYGKMVEIVKAIG